MKCLSIICPVHHLNVYLCFVTFIVCSTQRLSRDLNVSKPGAALASATASVPLVFLTEHVTSRCITVAV